MPIFSLKSIAYRYIKDKILSCEIRGGERLREDILAEELEISRTPVREAINQLVMEGLVESVPRKGLYCVEITPGDINDLCDMRYIYESYAIRRCITLCTPEQLEPLVRLAKNFEESSKQEKSVAILDDQFHEKLIHLAGNQHLTSTYSLIYNQLHILRIMTEKTAPKLLSSKVASEQHFLLVECIRNKDEAIAMATTEDHIEQMRKYLSQKSYL